MNNHISICGDQAVHIPQTGCNDCAELSSRLEELENLLANMRRVAIAKTDINGQTVTMTGVGIVTTEG